MQTRYVWIGAEIHAFTANRIMALKAKLNELDSGYDAGCFIDDLDHEDQFEIREELDNWVSNIPNWWVAEFFPRYIE